MFDLGLGVSMGSLTSELQTDEIETLAKSDISTFELGPHNFARDFDRHVRNSLLTMLRSTGKQAVSYHIPFMRRDDLSDPEERIRREAVSRFRALLQEAVFFGVRIIVLHPSTEPVDQNRRDEHIAQLRKSMLEVEPELRAYNMRLALEFLPRECMGNTLPDIEKMLESMSDVFGCCADVNHLMGQYREIPEMIRRLGSRLITLHLSDYDGIDERHWLPRKGEGVIDWKAVVAALREIDYRGPFNLEINLHDKLTLSERIAEMEETYRWLKSL